MIEFSTFIYIVITLFTIGVISIGGVEGLKTVIIIPLVLLVTAILSLIIAIPILSTSYIFWLVVFHFDKLAKFHHFIQGL